MLNLFRRLAEPHILPSLKAIDEYLLRKGFDEKELPESVDGYSEALRKHLMVHNGKLLKEFEKLYKLLHIAGYYRGLLEDVIVVKDALKAAKIFVEKIK
jgi:hypothetical protein